MLGGGAGEGELSKGRRLKKENRDSGLFDMGRMRDLKI
jgi:hypothetical protein